MAERSSWNRNTVNGIRICKLGHILVPNTLRCGCAIGPAAMVYVVYTYSEYSIYVLCEILGVVWWIRWEWSETQYKMLWIVGIAASYADHLSIASPSTVISKDFCMIFHPDSHGFTLFGTIIGPDPTVPPTVYGVSTVAPLREIQLYNRCAHWSYMLYCFYWSQRWLCWDSSWS